MSYEEIRVSILGFIVNESEYSNLLALISSKFTGTTWNKLSIAEKKAFLKKNIKKWSVKQ